MSTAGATYMDSHQTLVESEFVMTPSANQPRVLKISEQVSDKGSPGEQEQR